MSETNNIIKTEPIIETFSEMIRKSWSKQEKYLGVKSSYNLAKILDNGKVEIKTFKKHYLTNKQVTIINRLRNLMMSAATQNLTFPLEFEGFTFKSFDEIENKSMLILFKWMLGFNEESLDDYVFEDDEELIKEFDAFGVLSVYRILLQRMTNGLANFQTPSKNTSLST